MNPSFSIIVPAYNAEKTLPLAVASLKEQLGDHDELIIVDDGSLDKTRATAQALSKEDPRIHLIVHEKNGGRLQARKTGIQNAAGDYILFLDADDEFEKDTLSILRNELIKQEVDILHFGLQFIDHSFSKEGIRRKEKEGYLAPFKGKLNNDDLFKACFNEDKYIWTLPNKCFKASVCKKAISFLPDARIQRGEDIVIYFAIAFFSKSYYGLADKDLYLYNFGNGQDNYRQIDLKEYEGFLESRAAFDGIESFLSSVDHQPFHETGAISMGHKLARNCVLKAKTLLKPDEKAAGYRAFIDTWGSFACAALRQEFRNNELNLFKEKLFDESNQKRQNKKYIATYYHKISGGGVEGVLHSLIKIWKSLGYEVFLFLNEEAEETALKELGVSSFCILPKLDATVESTRKREEAIRQTLELYDIDLVVYHAWVNKALPWDMITFKSFGVSFVIHCHSSFSYYALTADPYFSSMPYIYSQADALVSLSETDATFWRIFNKNVFTTINPPTYSCDKVHPIDPCANEKNILWLARISPEKKPENIIKAFELIALTIPDAKLTLVGSATNQAYGNKIDELIEKSPAKDRIKRVPWTNAQDSYYSSARVFAMTSDEGEGYPLTLAESKTFGLPCVMFDLPYLTLAQEGSGVLTAPVGDIYQYAKLITDVLTNDELCKKLSAEARKSMEDLVGFDFAGLWTNIFKCARENVIDDKTTHSLTWETFLIAYLNGCKKQAAESNRQKSEIKRLNRKAESLSSKAESLNRKVEDLNRKIESLNRKIKKFQNSNSWKIGRVITWIPRKMKRYLKSQRNSR